MHTTQCMFYVVEVLRLSSSCMLVMADCTQYGIIVVVMIIIALMIALR